VTTKIRTLALPDRCRRKGESRKNASSKRHSISFCVGRVILASYGLDQLRTHCISAVRFPSEAV
jgi:hypothetical protein